MNYAEQTLRKELVTIEWALNKWKEAQEKTFDRTRTLIFVEN